MEKQLLREQNIFPTDKVIKISLGDTYLVFNELIKTITTKYGLLIEWRYYKDGKAWLCKICYKKRTIFWLSVWDKFFKVGFYFSEKNCFGITELDIDDNIKEDFNRSKAIGKLIPLIINMYRKEQIDDILKIIEYKKKLK